VLLHTHNALMQISNLGWCGVVWCGVVC
jgi:hypothetical protein